MNNDNPVRYKSKKTKFLHNNTVYKLYSTPVLKTKKQYPPPFLTECFVEPLSRDQLLALNLTVKIKDKKVQLFWNEKLHNSLDTEHIKKYELFMCKETDEDP